ncbi:MAG: flagellar motor switch protein FliN [Planctomycetaceae bacterium]
MSPENVSLGSPQPFVFDSLDLPTDEEVASLGLDVPRDADLDMRIELGRAELQMEEIMRLKEGSVVPLDKLAGDPVDILVNDRLIARGEVLVLNDNFCVRVAEILAPRV